MSNETPHDSLFRFAFSQPVQAEDHFRRNLPDAVVTAVDWKTLQLRPGTFVDPSLQHLHSDVLYRAKLKRGGQLFLYVLFEHQRTPDRWMPWRMLRYMVRIWDAWLSERSDRPPPLPFIVPMVLYNGAESWNVPLSFAELLPQALWTELPAHVPDFVYQLQDLSQIPDEAIQGEALKRLVLLLLKHGGDADFWERFPEWVGALATITRQPADGLKALEALWRYIMTVTPRSPPASIMAMLATELPEQTQEVLVTWGEQLKQEGLEEGKLQGQAKLLLKLLRLKFGALDQAVVTLVETGSEADIERWSERILTAETLEALFA